MCTNFRQLTGDSFENLWLDGVFILILLLLLVLACPHQFFYFFLKSNFLFFLFEAIKFLFWVPNDIHRSRFPTRDVHEGL